MKKIKKNDCSQIIYDFFEVHLKSERKFSGNTIESYIQTMKLFIKFCEEYKNIKNRDLKIIDFSKQNILDFLVYIEKTRKCNASTRNQRLASINSFLEYASSINPIYIKVFYEVKSIKYKKQVNKIIDYLSIEEYKYYINVIDITTRTGYKDFVLINLLYDSACRVEELINIKLEDFTFAEISSLKIIGKGNKQRQVYLSTHIVSILREYFTKFKITKGYIFKSKMNDKYSRFGVAHIIRKYHQIVAESCKTLSNKNITPHTFRHSKACHFLLNGTPLPVIQRFLGHSNLKTTEMYLKVTSDVIIKAVEDVSNFVNNNEQIKPIWKDNEDVINMLEELSKCIEY